MDGAARRLVFADSEVAAVQAAGSALQVRFAAAAVEPLPGAGAAAEAGQLLGLVLELQGARWQGDAPAACFGRLRAGVLSDGVSRLAAIALPFDGPGPWRLELTFAQGQQLQVDAAHVRAVPGGDARFVPSYAC